MTTITKVNNVDLLQIRSLLNVQAKESTTYFRLTRFVAVLGTAGAIQVGVQAVSWQDDSQQDHHSSISVSSLLNVQAKESTTNVQAKESTTNVQAKESTTYFRLTRLVAVLGTTGTIQGGGGGGTGGVLAT